MIYGYGSEPLNEFGLREMREVSIAASPADLRRLAKFLTQTADEFEENEVSVHWHRHSPDDLSRSLGCDVIVLGPEE